MNKEIRLVNGEGQIYLSLICKEIIAYFQNLQIRMDEMPIDIKGGMPCPRFCPAEINILGFHQIHLTMTNYSYWCQVIFQLSHELTHYFIYCYCKDERQKASWIEETICEAISLYFLAWYGENWEKTLIYRYNTGYGKSVNEYLENEIQNKGTRRLTLCQSYQELMEIDRTSQERREDRQAERNELFNLIHARDILGLISYRDYIIQDKKILDCDRYLEDYAYNFPVRYLCDLQKKVLSEDKLKSQEA